MRVFLPAAQRMALPQCCWALGQIQPEKGRHDKTAPDHGRWGGGVKISGRLAQLIDWSAVGIGRIRGGRDGGEGRGSLHSAGYIGWTIKNVSFHINFYKERYIFHCPPDIVLTASPVMVLYANIYRFCTLCYGQKCNNRLEWLFGPLKKEKGTSSQ